MNALKNSKIIEKLKALWTYLSGTLRSSNACVLLDSCKSGVCTFLWVPRSSLASFSHPLFRFLPQTGYPMAFLELFWQV